MVDIRKIYFLWNDLLAQHNKYDLCIRVEFWHSIDELN